MTIAHHAIIGAASAGEAGHRYWRLLAIYPSWGSGFGGYYWGMLYCNMFASIDNTGSDLALGKTAFASSQFSGSYVPSNATDGNIGTSWQTSNPSVSPAWWYVDFVTPVEIHSLSLSAVLSAGALLPQNIALQWSDDTVIWTTQTSFPTANVGGNQDFGNL